jgi:hypothetical protein
VWQSQQNAMHTCLSPPLAVIIRMRDNVQGSKFLVIATPQVTIGQGQQIPAHTCLSLCRQPSRSVSGSDDEGETAEGVASSPSEAAGSAPEASRMAFPPSKGGPASGSDLHAGALLLAPNPTIPQPYAEELWFDMHMVGLERTGYSTRETCHKSLLTQHTR